MPDLIDWNWGYEGVTLYDDHLLWYENMGSVSFAGGSACQQTFAEFLTSGPNTLSIPPDVLEAVTRAVRERMAGANDVPK